MTTIALLDAHPDPDRQHYINALCDAYARGAMRGGHDLARINLSDMDFPILRRPGDWKNGPPPGFEAARAAFDAAEHVVIAFPLWLGGMPALLRGFFEQLTAGGFGIAPAADGKGWTQKFKGKSARLIVTMGMPALIYQTIFSSHGVKVLERNILGFAGMGPIRETLIGMVEAKSPLQRQRCLQRVEKLGEAAR